MISSIITSFSEVIQFLFFRTARGALILYYSLYDVLYKPNRDQISSTNLKQDPQLGSWEKDIPLPSYRYEFSAAGIGKVIYVVGGIREPSVWFPTSLFESYNIETKKWDRLQSLPKPIHHTATASDDRYVYVVGGDNIRISPSKSVFRYDTFSKKWEKLPDMPTKRGALGAAIIDNVLYAVGGADYGKKYSLLEALDLKTMKWQRYTDMPTPREHIAVAVSPLGLHVLGGYNTDRFGSMTTHEIYNPKKNTWSSATPIPIRICGLMSSAVGNMVYVIAGEQGWAVSKYVFGYNIHTKKWTRMVDLPIARYAGSAVAVDNVIHVLGGCEKMFTHHFSHAHDVFIPKHQ
jgi:kelch-like protein 2/3